MTISHLVTNDAGPSFAWAELKLMLIYLLLHYDFELLLQSTSNFRVNDLRTFSSRSIQNTSQVDKVVKNDNFSSLSPEDGCDVTVL